MEMMNAEPTIHKFYNPEQASLFMSRMLAEGHRAYLLDQGTGWLWGPNVVGGIRVVVYELTEEEQAIEIPPEPKLSQEIFPEWVGMVAVAFVATGLAAGAIFIFKSAEPGSSPLFGILMFILVCMITPAAIALLLMPVILRCVRALRAPETPLGSLLRLFVWLGIAMWFGFLAFSLILVITEIITFI
jgi:hypothetical protein